MPSKDQYLPGDPSKLLIRKVRRHLKHYGIVPVERLWRLMWEWARAVAVSYDRFGILGKRYAKRWPSASEIGAQYVALLLADMRDSCALKLPFRAAEQCPIAARVMLAPAVFEAGPKQLAAHAEVEP